MDFKLFFMAFWVVFLAELGDKTQVTALTLTTSGNGGPWTVFAGASTALVCSTALAVLCGSFLASWLNPKYIRLASAILFIVLGVVSLSQLAWTSKEFDEKPVETQTAEQVEMSKNQDGK